MKYLPDRKLIEDGRYKNYGIGIGLGRRKLDEEDGDKDIPGPGKYILPSVFDKRLQGRLPLN